jgi:hypothetical protein
LPVALATFASIGANAKESCSLLLLQKQEAQEAQEGTCGCEERSNQSLLFFFLLITLYSFICYKFK